MSVTTARMTVTEFLAMPDDPNVRRELVRGELREDSMTTRNPRHAGCVAKLTTALENWRVSRNRASMFVGAGDVRCRLPLSGDTVVGIDIGVFDGDEAVHQSKSDVMISVAPVIAVEVLSSSDTHESVREKVRLYLAAGVAQVWIADPDFHVISIYRKDHQPQFRNADEVLTAEPELEGFSVRVASLFTQ